MPICTHFHWFNAQHFKACFYRCSVVWLSDVLLILTLKTKSLIALPFPEHRFCCSQIWQFHRLTSLKSLVWLKQCCSCNIKVNDDQVIMVLAVMIVLHAIWNWPTAEWPWPWFLHRMRLRMFRALIIQTISCHNLLCDNLMTSPTTNHFQRDRDSNVPVIQVHHGLISGQGKAVHCVVKGSTEWFSEQSVST